MNRRETTRKTMKKLRLTIRIGLIGCLLIAIALLKDVAWFSKIKMSMLSGDERFVESVASAIR